MGIINNRRLGVYGADLPTKKNLSVQAADFAVGGIIGDFERKFNRTFVVNNVQEVEQIFGKHISSSDYGWDAVNGFFDNLSGVSASLYIQSFIGYTGGAIDAVVASRDKADVGADADAYVVQPAYETELEYGTSGNRTATKFIQADRFATEAAGTCPATGQSYAELDSVAGIKVGDLILFKTNGGASPVYKIVTDVDESQNRVSWTGNFEVSGGSAETLAINDEVTIPGFYIEVYRKSTSGVVEQVETDLSRIICSSESAVTEFYVDNVWAASKFIKVTEGSASTLGDRLPVTDTDPVYCTSGANGTAITTAAQVTPFLANFNEDPIRFLADPEHTDVDIQKALETYCTGRAASDFGQPLTLYNIVADRTKAQLIVIGNGYQRSAAVLGMIPANWLEISDPFSTAVNAPPREVPNVGHIMGAYIRAIEIYGIHYVPSTELTPLLGASGVVGDQFKDDQDRTDLAEAGINVIQEIQGGGIRLRNSVTPSTTEEWYDTNGLLMRNFIRVSAINSLKPTENEPNNITRIQASGESVLLFLYDLWDRGSTGTVPEGETFGQTVDDAGEFTQKENHLEVVANGTNNSQTDINAGKRNIDVYFTKPGIAKSIRIGVGIVLLS